MMRDVVHTGKSLMSWQGKIDKPSLQYWKACMCVCVCVL